MALVLAFDLLGFENNVGSLYCTNQDRVSSKRNLQWVLASLPSVFTPPPILGKANHKKSCPSQSCVSRTQHLHEIKFRYAPYKEKLGSSDMKI